jgi:hypothetical protein
MSTSVVTLDQMLKETLAEKERIERQYADDSDRIDQRISEIEKAMLAYLADLQTLKTMGQVVMTKTHAGHYPASMSLSPKCYQKCKGFIVDKILPLAIVFIILWLLWTLLASYEKPKQTGQVQFMPSAVASVGDQYVDIIGIVRDRMPPPEFNHFAIDEISAEDENTVECSASETCEIKHEKTVRQYRQPVRTFLRTMMRR